MAKQTLSNCNYNCTKHLQRKLSFLHNVRVFIKDAEEEGHKTCASMWKKIAKDEAKHCSMLKKAIVTKAKKGHFK